MFMPDYTWHEVVFALLTLLSATAVGLSAVWLALGRGHWFVRVVAVLAILSLPLFVPADSLVPAHGLLVIPAFQLLLAVPILLIGRQLRASKQGLPAWQFGVRDLLLLTVVVAVVAAVGVRMPHTVWESDNLFIGMVEFGSWRSQTISPLVYTVSFAMAVGAATCLAAWIVLGHCRRWIRLTVLLIGLPLAAGIFEWMYRSNLPQQPQPAFPGFVAIPPRAFSLPELGFAEILVGYFLSSLLIMVVWLFLFRASKVGQGSAEVGVVVEGRKCRRRIQLARAGLVVLTLTLLVPLAGAYWSMMTPPAIPAMTLPEPNGYIRLVEVAQPLLKVVVPDPQRSQPIDFIEFERQHRGLLLEAREALELPSMVPVDYEKSYYEAALDRNQSLRQLARAMRAAGEAASMNGDDNQAVQWHVDTIRLGRSTWRGGLIVDWLVGTAIEGIGMQLIHEDASELSPGTRREVLAALDRLGDEAEPFEVIQIRDEVWTQNAYGWLGRLTHCVDKLVGQQTRVRELQESLAMRRLALRRILLVELALENYHDARGHYPETLDELMPDELVELPVDPFTGGPLKYRVTSEGFLVYSVGPNRQDDRGATPDSQSPGDDVRFER